MQSNREVLERAWHTLNMCSHACINICIYGKRLIQMETGSNTGKRNEYEEGTRTIHALIHTFNSLGQNSITESGQYIFTRLHSYIH